MYVSHVIEQCEADNFVLKNNYFEYLIRMPNIIKILPNSGILVFRTLPKSFEYLRSVATEQARQGRKE